MCAITGWINHKENINAQIKTVEAMSAKLSARGPDAFIACLPDFHEAWLVTICFRAAFISLSPDSYNIVRIPYSS